MNIVTVVYGILIILILAMFHELGHFFAAKLSGIGVEELSLGFGPTIYKKESGGTVYKIGALPILGYAKIKGMESDFEAPDGYFKKGLWSRFFTVFAGPLMNFVVAILLFTFVFAAFGNPFTPTTIVAKVINNSPAYYAGLKSGDKIIQIDGKTISSWQEITDTIHSANGKILSLIVDRDGNILTLSVTPQKDKITGQWLIGIYPTNLRYPVAVSFWEGIKWTGNTLYKMFTFVPMLFTKAGLSSIAGPIGIIAMTSQAAAGGFAELVWFTAFISIALGFTNLLPIPALDGSWIVLVLWEAITRKPVPPEKQTSVQGIGFIFILGLMVLVSLRDIVRLIGK
jgi:regulator of sigma E protease